MKLTTFAIVAAVLVCVAFAFANPVEAAADDAVASFALREIVTAFRDAAVALWNHAPR